MNDLQLLLVVLAAFYLWECANWIRRPGVVFRSWLGGAFRLGIPGGALSNRLGGFLFAPPLPGLGAFFSVQWPPVLFTSEAIVAHRDPLDLRDDIPPAGSDHLRFDQIKNVEIRRHHVWINRKKFVTAGSPSSARTLVRLIEELKATGPEQRDEHIEGWLRKTLDGRAVSERMDLWRNCSGWLGSFCMLEFAIVVSACVWLIRDLSLREVWPWFVGGLVLVNTLATILFCRAHRRLFPEALDERIQHTVMMAVFPLATVRAVDVLSRPLLENFHPLAVAGHLMGRDEFAGLAKRQLRRVRVWSRETPGNARAFFRQLEAEMVKFLRGAGVDVVKLLEPPAANDPECRSFCPRCESQFTFGSGRCGDCGSIPVEPVAGKTG